MDIYLEDSGLGEEIRLSAQSDNTVPTYYMTDFTLVEWVESWHILFHGFLSWFIVSTMLAQDCFPFYNHLKCHSPLVSVEFEICSKERDNFNTRTEIASDSWVDREEYL